MLNPRLHEIISEALKGDYGKTCFEQAVLALRLNTLQFLGISEIMKISWCNVLIVEKTSTISVSRRFITCLRNCECHSSAKEIESMKNRTMVVAVKNESWLLNETNNGVIPLAK